LICVPKSDCSRVARQTLISLCFVAGVCVSCTPAVPHGSTQNQLPPIRRSTAVSTCARHSGDGSRASSRVVDTVGALVKAGFFAYEAGESPPASWAAAAPYFSRVFAGNWLKGFAGADSMRLVWLPAPPPRTDTLQYLCAWQTSELVSSFVLGATTGPGAVLQTSAVDEVFARARYSEQGAVYTSGDSAVSDVTLFAIRDTLRLVESLLGARAVRPAFVHISSTDAMHDAALPFQPPGTVFRGFTVAMIGRPGLSMAAPGPGPHSTLVHELTHLALAGAKDPIFGKLVIELAEEALARAVDGRSRSSPGLLTEATVRTVLSTPSLRRARIDSLDTRSPDAAALLDVLGAIYRVHLLRCTAFPLRLLMAPAANSIDEAVQALGWQLGQSPDGVEATVIAALGSGPILGHDLRMRGLSCR
jgi:hypothetical protein